MVLINTKIAQGIKIELKITQKLFSRDEKSGILLLEQGRSHTTE